MCHSSPGSLRFHWSSKNANKLFASLEVQCAWHLHPFPIFTFSLFVKVGISSFKPDLGKILRMIDSGRLVEKHQGVLIVNWLNLKKVKKGNVNSVGLARGCLDYLVFPCYFALFCFMLRYVWLYNVQSRNIISLKCMNTKKRTWHGHPVPLFPVNFCQLSVTRLQ